MSGHSKWSTIKRKKGETDAKRANIFTKISREISVAVKTGGADPATNSKLKDLIVKARSSNVPNDNIDRVIKRASSDGEKDSYDSITYEGYGPCGVAVIVETLTDNRNRTAGDLRHYFDKFGGNMGQVGCVSFLFDKKGLIVLDNEDGLLDEDKVMEDCMDAGAADVDFDDDAVEILTEPQDFSAVRDALSDKGYVFAAASVEMIPSTMTAIPDEELRIK
ncbi:MAG: YebC/PmpR family DNA-binding transcriptional regulator, partial [Oscillospiraceae bacterium]